MHLVDTTRVCFIVNEHITMCTPLSHMLIRNAQSIYISVIKHVSVFIPKLGIKSHFVSCWFMKINGTTSQWRHNGRDGVSNHQPHDCLLNRLFKRIWKKASRHWTLCGVTGEFPAQRVSNAENVPVWWRHNESYFRYPIVMKLSMVAASSRCGRAVVMSHTEVSQWLFIFNDKVFFYFCNVFSKIKVAPAIIYDLVRNDLMNRWNQNEFNMCISVT